VPSRGRNELGPCPRLSRPQVSCLEAVSHQTSLCQRVAQNLAAHAELPRQRVRGKAALERVVGCERVPDAVFETVLERAGEHRG
jgi:hypothetical protein